MEELAKLWLKPEYMPMFAIITLTLKTVVVPLVKSFVTKNPKGYSPVIIAHVAGVLIAFIYKGINSGCSWHIQDITMVVLVGVFAAQSAIGLNVTTQSISGKDINIPR